MAFCLSFGFYMHNPVLCYPYGVICVKNLRENYKFDEQKLCYFAFD
jgi:hypothetical protein